jgi:type I restriction enzyme M protein
LHPDLKAVLMPVRKDPANLNPPFNMIDWGGENRRQDARWEFGRPPVNNANYAGIDFNRALVS